MVPRQDVPRSTFRTEHTHKTTVQGGYLVPILIEEILPGDTIKGTMTLFARMATLLFPLMDHIIAETFFFFCPSRLLWTNWKKMMGEQNNPGDSISYTVPYIASAAGGFANLSVFDYMGIPGLGQISGGATIRVNALPLRMYNFVWNEWFRDENIQNSVDFLTDDGPDNVSHYSLLKRNKKHDYFTSALPWPLKGGVSVTMPLSGTAPIQGIGVTALLHDAVGAFYTDTDGVTRAYPHSGNVGANTAGWGFRQTTGDVPSIYADLSQATGATIAALRLAVQTQRFLERDARSGTRYTELLKAHFGVQPEDFRLQRPEYVGGGKSSIQTQAIPQTSATGLTGGATPTGALTGASTATGQHHFRYDAKEHGYLLGLIHFDAELTYQQGLHRMWTRTTRYDFYWPVFAHLSEQAIRNDEIYVDGGNNDPLTFGYQERWAEYRHKPSRISGYFRSTTASTIDPWHSAQKFTTLPTLNSTFLASTPPFARNLAAGSAADFQQFLLDMLFQITHTRPMPMFSVPGGMDRF